MADRILIVEDEEKLNRMIELELKYEGYETGKTLDGRTGLDMALSGGYDLVLLDIMLPGLNGLEVLRRIRKENERLPVILLTARDTTMDKVSGLDSGADDYVTKPFAIEELLARVRLALRHRVPAVPAAPAAEKPLEEPAVASPKPTTALTAGPLSLDVDRHAVEVAGEPVELTNREFEVLRALLENKDIVMSRDRLASVACGYDYVGETNIIDVYIRHLRAKIDDRFGIKLITTVRGVGYVVRAS